MMKSAMLIVLDVDKEDNKAKLIISSAYNDPDAKVKKSSYTSTFFNEDAIELHENIIHGINDAIFNQHSTSKGFGKKIRQEIFDELKRKDNFYDKKQS